MRQLDKDRDRLSAGTLDEADQSLFRQAVGEVRRIHAEALPERPKPAPEARQSEADERAVIASLNAPDVPTEGAEGGDVLSYLAPGYRRRWLRRLIRGQFVIADEIDLHNLDLKRAGRILADFLKHARANDRHCVRVIHGKGGARGSVLKAMVERDLLRRIEVIAFHSAPRGQGGTGAVDVLLRAQR